MSMMFHFNWFACTQLYCFDLVDESMASSVFRHRSAPVSRTVDADLVFTGPSPAGVCSQMGGYHLGSGRYAARTRRV